MLERLRQALQTTGGKMGAAIAVLIALGVVYWSFQSNLGTSEAAAYSRKRMFICSETKKPYELKLELGMPVPAPSPYSGKNTGYPAEPCYWKADGTQRADAFYVLLDEYIGKPGPTFCPDCGRLVRPNNPEPAVRGKAPPLKKDYDPRKGDEQ